MQRERLGHLGSVRQRRSDGLDSGPRPSLRGVHDSLNFLVQAARKGIQWNGNIRNSGTIMHLRRSVSGRGNSTALACPRPKIIRTSISIWAAKRRFFAPIVGHGSVLICDWGHPRPTRRTVSTQNRSVDQPTVRRRFEPMICALSALQSMKALCRDQRFPETSLPIFADPASRQSFRAGWPAIHAGGPRSPRQRHEGERPTMVDIRANNAKGTVALLQLDDLEYMLGSGWPDGNHHCAVWLQLP